MFLLGAKASVRWYLLSHSPKQGDISFYLTIGEQPHDLPFIILV
jgi:hypothetical protein